MTRLISFLLCLFLVGCSLPPPRYTLSADKPNLTVGDTFTLTVSPNPKNKPIGDIIIQGFDNDKRVIITYFNSTDSGRPDCFELISNDHNATLVYKFVNKPNFPTLDNDGKPNGATTPVSIDQIKVWFSSNRSPTSNTVVLAIN